MTNALGGKPGSPAENSPSSQVESALIPETRGGGGEAPNNSGRLNERQEKCPSAAPGGCLALSGDLWVVMTVECSWPLGGRVPTCWQKSYGGQDCPHNKELSNSECE